MPALTTPTLAPAVADELATLRARLLGAEGLELDLDAVADQVARVAKRVGDTTTVGRRLTALHDLLASHLLAALDLDLAGLPPERSGRLLARARLHLADGIERVLVTTTIG